MKKIQVILLGLVLLLAACTSAATEPAASEPPVRDEGGTTDEPLAAPEGEATAVKPQFIMFTASW